jgi:uncharacterized OsmC-like protein
VPASAKELRYSVDLHEGGRLRVEDGTPLAVDPAWTPEHLVLAALVRCALKSLDYHARRTRLEVSDAEGFARSLVTKRESDGRYAMTECDVELAVRVTPRPSEVELEALLAKAERDCFVGASLTVTPTYRWTVR